MPVDRAHVPVYDHEDGEEWFRWECSHCGFENLSIFTKVGGNDRA